MRYFLSMRFLMKTYRFYLLVLVALASWVVTISFDLNIKMRATPQNLFEIYQTEFLTEQGKAKEKFNELSEMLLSQKALDLKLLKQQNVSDGQMAIFLFKRDSLIWWNSSRQYVSSFWKDSDWNTEVVKLSTGWFTPFSEKKGDNILLALVPIMDDYPVENRFFKKQVLSPFLSSGIVLTNPNGQYVIRNEKGNPLFSLDFKGLENVYRPYVMTLFGLYTLSIVLLISVLYICYRRILLRYQNPLWLVGLISVSVLIIRVLMQYFQLPGSLYDSNLFSPYYFASSVWIPSLGDLIWSVLALFTVAIVFYRRFKQKKKRERNSIRIVFLVFTLVLHVFIFFRLLSGFLESIVMNSNVPLDLNNIFSLNQYSCLLILTIACLILSYFLITMVLLRIICAENSRYFIWGMVLSLFFYSGWSYYNGYDEWLGIILITLYVVGFWVLYKYSSGVMTFAGVLFFIVVFSLLTATQLQSIQNSREIQQRKLMAIKLSTGRDQMAEYLFEELSAIIKQDSIIVAQMQKVPLKAEYEDSIIRRIERKFLNGYWERFSKLVTICYHGKQLQIAPDDYIMGCFDYFDGIISSMGELTLSDNLFYIDNQLAETNYVGSVNFSEADTAHLNLSVYIEFTSRYTTQSLGYPELLLDHHIASSLSLDQYSYAIYVKDNMMRSAGDYQYPTYQYGYDGLHDDFYLHSDNEYSHLFHRISDDTFLILSKPKNSWIDKLALFSYILLFFGFGVIVYNVIYRVFAKGKYQSVSLQHRIQFVMVVVIFTSFIIIGVTFLYYIIGLNTDKNREILSEKMHSVLVEMEHKLDQEERLTVDMSDYLNGLLVKFSNVFFSDINIYGTDGFLLASSRPQLFEKQLMSQRMNPSALMQIAGLRKSYFIHQENIGEYSFLSAYIPFRNLDGKIIGYLNLPYFARQSELQEEIGAFLITFANIFVVLTALAIIIALIISNYITLPLKLMQNHMSLVKLGGANTKLNWNRKDEIGELIEEYNRMVDELDRSVSLLARSERESAWREMARQVAHEIKNPLTPMKLSVQYLQRAWKNQTDDFDERMKRFTDTLIEQIDGLSVIASEFSDFAKMPQQIKSCVNIQEVAQNAAQLFGKHDDITVSFFTDGQDYTVWADKKQMLRVFNNLLKNSLQAIQATEAGKGSIEVVLSRKQDNCRIEVRDTGIGIRDEQKEKIFTPSFTTKSSGMGIGLSMVKNIILSCAGEIWFESEIGRGTSFFITLPAHTPGKSDR